MAVKLRLRRQGRKGRPFYHIVAADSRSPRDGKFLEKVGTYNPIADPADINVDMELAIKWLRNGAQPTDTVRSIFRYAGVNMKYALIKQGKSEEEIERIFSKWWEEKQAKVAAKKESLREGAKAAKAEALKAESKVREARAAAIAAKRTPEEEPAAEAPAAEAPAVEAEAAVEAPAVEEAPAPEAEAPAEEAPAAEAEAPAEEAPAAEAEAPAEEAPAAEAEAPAEEAPAAEAEAPAEEAKEEE